MRGDDLFDTDKPLTFGVTEESLKQLYDALERNDKILVGEIFSDLHPADAADIVQGLDAQEQAALLKLLPAALLPGLLSYLPEPTRDILLADLGVDALAAVVGELDTDDAVDLLFGLPEDLRSSVLDAVPDSDRLQLLESLKYPEDSAGRLMQRDLVAVPAHWTVGHTVDFMRASQALPDDFHEIYVVDPRFVPIGHVALSRLLRSQRNTPLSDIMMEDFRTTSVLTEQEEVGHLFRKYGLVSLPVTDRSGRLVGVVTVDDVVSLIAEEADEGLLRLSGVSDPVDFYRAAATTAKGRFFWLFVNLLTAMLASGVIAQFEGELQTLVTLAVLLPIIPSMGGNAGTQTLAVVVRALALRQITKRNFWRVLRKEVLVAFINGFLFTFVCFAGVGLFYGAAMWKMALVTALALAINLIAAALGGVLIPLAMKRAKVDPAITATVFLTTVTDVVGFLSFLGLASLILL
ncbi:MAG: magnesium transporter [Holosporales bacterium]